MFSTSIVFINVLSFSLIVVHEARSEIEPPR